MKFYDCSTAPSPRRVRIFLAEKGISIPTVQVDLRNGEQFSPAFRAINPDCTVPALVLDDGTVIADAVAICGYLEEQHPEPPLIGTTPQERAVVTALNRQIERDGLFAAMDAFRNTAKGLKGRELRDLLIVVRPCAGRALLPRHGRAPRRARIRGRLALHHCGHFHAGADGFRRLGQAVDSAGVHAPAPLACGGRGAAKLCTGIVI